MRQVKLRVNKEKCTGCLSCVLACSFSHFKYFDMSKSRVSVSGTHDLAEFEPSVCIQCEERYCVKSCPTGALSVNSATGVVTLDKDKCVGCKVCLKSCPYGGVKWDADSSNPLICDLCGGDPQCVKHCRYPEALYVEEG